MCVHSPAFLQDEIMEYVIKLAGIPFSISFAFKQYVPLFLPYIAHNEIPAFHVEIPAETIEGLRNVYPNNPPDSYIEMMELYPILSDSLIPYGRCFFHGCAFLWNGKAYIFVAPSGTGKSTQFILWKLVYGNEIRILNGDKPILEFRQDDSIWVHPSPWQGKENIGRMESAELGGLIYLQKSQENRIALMTTKEAVLPVLQQFLFSAGSSKDVLAVCAMEEKLLTQVSVWRLENRGDEASAILCHDFIEKEKEL